MISTGNECKWSDCVITTTSLIYSDNVMSGWKHEGSCWNAVVFNWTILLACANPFSSVAFCPCHVCCPSHSKRATTHTNAERDLSGSSVEGSFKSFKGGLSFCRVVTLSLRSRGARLNTSYSDTKRGCDVHTNEPIIGGFVTQFLLSLISRTNTLCARVCVCTCTLPMRGTY